MSEPKRLADMVETSVRDNRSLLLRARLGEGETNREEQDVVPTEYFVMTQVTQGIEHY